jgi:oxygen-independent coproporphyrinogen-3 oxidase
MTGLDGTTLQPALSECEKQGLVKLDNGYYVCTEQGWNFLDGIVGEFIA